MVVVVAGKRFGWNEEIRPALRLSQSLFGELDVPVFQIKLWYLCDQIDLSAESDIRLKAFV